MCNGAKREPARPVLPPALVETLLSCTEFLSLQGCWTLLCSCSCTATQGITGRWQDEAAPAAFPRQCAPCEPPAGGEVCYSSGDAHMQHPATGKGSQAGSCWPPLPVWELGWTATPPASASPSGQAQRSEPPPKPQCKMCLRSTHQAFWSPCKQQSSALSESFQTAIQLEGQVQFSSL